jgi:hypothetical protein
MKLISTGKRICILLALTLLITSIQMPVQAASKLKLNNKTLDLFVGDTATLTVTNTKKTVKWSSEDKKIATVNSKGKVTAKKKGSATITARVGNRKVSCVVVVFNTNEKKGCYYKITNKLVGDYSDKDQEVTYAVIHSGTLSVYGDASNVTRTKSILVGCGNKFLTNTGYKAHCAEGCMANVSVAMGGDAYTFTLKNNETATIYISGKKGQTNLFLVRIYDSSKVKNNMSAKYKVGSGATLNMPIWDINAGDGLEGILLSDDTQKTTIYNAGNQIGL